MIQRNLVLCVGMHRSGTSLTASLLQGIGLSLPGKLISPDVANPSGYFENRSIVDAQENLLRELGYWWPTEAASHGLPRRVRKSGAYRSYQEWLTSYLEEVFTKEEPSLAIKDPRSSLLLPAWRTAAARLGIRLRLVICLRDPRDVCWSLVWRDGASVGLGWERAQRLWLEHYRAILVDGKGLPATVARYEHWLDPELAIGQLERIALFLGLAPTYEQRNDALKRVRPEFNHGGGEQLPTVSAYLGRMYAAVLRSSHGQQSWFWSGIAAPCYSLALKAEGHLNGARSWLRLLRLFTSEGREQIAPALDRELLRNQLGRSSLWLYWRKFKAHEDLRPHPLISPAYINLERRKCGLPVLRTAGELFLHLLNADMLPMNPHPWFNCRTYQNRSQLLGLAGEHTILSYLRAEQQGMRTPYLAAELLKQLGAARPVSELTPLPPVIQCLRPGLILADPLKTLGDPSTGESAVVRAHESYWQALEEAFTCWPTDSDADPLNWFVSQGEDGLGAIARCSNRPAEGTACWWLPGDWPAVVLAELCGADLVLHRRLESADSMLEGLGSGKVGDPPPLIALTPSLLATALRHKAGLPRGTVILNLCWPEREQQSAWLHLLAQASTVLECRPAVRAYLHSLGLPVVWPSAPAIAKAPVRAQNARTVLLTFTESEAEYQLARCAHKLDPTRYSAFLRLDAQMISLGSHPEAPGRWLREIHSQHNNWIWLTGTPTPEDVRGWAIWAWAEHHGIAMKALGAGDQNWMDSFSKNTGSA